MYSFLVVILISLSCWSQVIALDVLPSSKQAATCLPQLQFVRTASYGGTQGFNFDDTNSLRYNERVSKIGIRTASRVDRMEFTTQFGIYGHGGRGGQYKSLALGSREKIVRIDLCWDFFISVRIFYVKFYTNLGKNLEGGVRTSNCATINIPGDRVVVGMYGKSGSEIDRVGFVHRLPLC